MRAKSLQYSGNRSIRPTHASSCRNSFLVQTAGDLSIRPLLHNPATPTFPSISQKNPVELASSRNRELLLFVLTEFSSSVPSTIEAFSPRSCTSPCVAAAICGSQNFGTVT